MSKFYDNPDLFSYTFLAIDFGNGLVSRLLAVPTDGPDSSTPGVGKRGRVLGALIHNITEDFSGTDAGVQVGDGSDVDLYYDSGTVLDATVDIGETLWLLDDGAQIDIPGGETGITVTFADAVTTGIADVALFIAWY